MRIHLAGDSTGYALARELESQLGSLGHDVVWHGAPQLDEGDDYPAHSVRVGKAVIADEDSGVPVRGVLVGVSGAGEVIAVNKVAGIRAVSATSVDVVTLAREHADVDVLTLGAAVLDAATALTLVIALIDVPFANLLEDARRIVNTNEFESAGTIEGWMQ